MGKFKYQDIIKDILQQIHSGTYLPGSRLPSENEMAKIYDASVPTVRHALDILVQQKEIYRIRGNGTFVSSEEITEEDFPDAESFRRTEDRICFVVVNENSDSSIMKMIRGAQMYLFNKGYTMTILCGKETIESELALLQECIDKKVTGVILFSMDPEKSISGIRALCRKGIKTVMLDRAPKAFPSTLVAAYNIDGGYQMAKYLLKLNHRKFLFASYDMSLQAEQDRFRGMQMALAEYGISYEESAVTNDLSTIVDAVRKDHITAVQCSNDKTAVAVIRALEHNGLRVPEDVSVAGFDNSDESEYNRPKVTTIDQPFEEMGRIAAAKLLSLLAGNPHTRVCVPVRLVVKESTAKPKER